MQGSIKIPKGQLKDVVPESRTITIDGVTYDLSSNRSWSTNSNSNSIITRKTITSTNLTTQDITGFLTYVNGATAFSIAANEHVIYEITDTGQSFLIYPNGISIGSGETALTSSEVLEVHPFGGCRCVHLVADIYDTTLTGSTSETIMNNPTLLPTQYLNKGSLDIILSGNRTVVTAGNTIVNLYINSSHSLVGATLIGTYASGTASSSRNLFFIRNIVFSSTQMSMANTIGTQTDAGQTSNQRNQNFNYVFKDNPYLIVTYKNGQTNTTATFEKINIKLYN
jgi:hypothetical protein